MTDWLSSGTWDLGVPERKRFESISNVIVGDSLCDLGCRDATLSLTYARDHPKVRVVGVDLSEDIDWANMMAAKLGIDNFVGMKMDLFDAESLGQFDTVVISEVLEHLPPNRVEEAYTLAQRMAKKRLIVTTPANSHISDPGHKSVYYREQFLRDENHGILGMPHLWIGFYTDK